MSETIEYQGVEIVAFDDCVYLKTNGSQYRVNLETVLRSLVEIDVAQDSIEAKPIKREYGVNEEWKQDTDIITTVMDEPRTITHELVVDSVDMMVSGIMDDNYWQGYKDGSGMSWEEIAWKHITTNGSTSTTFMKEVGKMFVDFNAVPCNSKNAFFPMGEWSTGVSGGYVNIMSEYHAEELKTCDDGDSHNWEQLNSQDSHNARVSNRYTCTKCGRDKKSITTG